ncbi:MAG: hypothetical protein PHY41_05480 [Candidatus Cloacimonetes bacterium]|nr:hypothetical protein [Candidatus Cloacimonadota bacterium]
MKSQLIMRQHVLLRLGIFVIGIFTGFEASFRQLAAQTLLVLLYLNAESLLYSSFLFAIRKLLSFFAAYWLLCLLFGVDFLQSLLFSFKIIYFVLITVAVWGSLHKASLLAQSLSLCRNKPCRAVISYILATYLFLKQYLSIYRSMQIQHSIYGMLDKAINAGKQLYEKSPSIEDKVNGLLAQNNPPPEIHYRANLFGLLFLVLLGLVNAL